MAMQGPLSFYSVLFPLLLYLSPRFASFSDVSLLQQ